MKALLLKPVPAWSLPAAAILAVLICFLLFEMRFSRWSDFTMVAIALVALLGTPVAVLTIFGHKGASGKTVRALDKNHALIELQVTRALDVVTRTGARETAYAGSLLKTQAQLAKPSTPELLRTLVGALTDESRRMSECSSAAGSELARARMTIEALRAALEKANAAALRDQVTDLGNRRAFDLQIEECIKTSSGERANLALIICDIDYFKQINDRFGHQAGDDVLRLIGSELTGSMRLSDIVTRYGGEEFAIILPRTKAQDASLVADRARAQIESRSFTLRQTGETIGRVTVSFGVTQFRIGETSAHLVKRADAALYHAKSQAATGSQCCRRSQLTTLLNRGETPAGRHRRREYGRHPLRGHCTDWKTAPTRTRQGPTRP